MDLTKQKQNPFQRLSLDSLRPSGKQVPDSIPDQLYLFLKNLGASTWRNGDIVKDKKLSLGCLVHALFSQIILFKVSA